MTISTLRPGDKIRYKGKCHTVVAIKRWSDQIHGRVYARDLEALGWTVVRVWQHEIKKDLPKVVEKIAALVEAKTSEERVAT